MLIQQKVSIVVPNIELGSMIAQKDAQVQSQILSGFARTQLLACRNHSQPIISLADLLTPETFIWLTRLYEESEKRQFGSIGGKLKSELTAKEETPYESYQV